MGTLTEAENFVFQNLLADTCKRLRQFDTAISELKLAWRSAPSIENLILFLPQGHRSLDLVLYHQVTRTIRNYDYLVCNDIPGDSLQPGDQAILRQTQVQDQCIRQSPGAFELKDYQLQNPCLRSCMEWCTVPTSLSDLPRSCVPGNLSCRSGSNNLSPNSGLEGQQKPSTQMQYTS
jgi:hypothetical protein